MKSVIFGILGLVVGASVAAVGASFANAVEEHRERDLVIEAQSNARLDGMLEAQARAGACELREQVMARARVKVCNACLIEEGFDTEDLPPGDVCETECSIVLDEEDAAFFDYDA